MLDLDKKMRKEEKRKIDKEGVDGCAPIISLFRNMGMCGNNLFIDFFFKLID